MTRLPCPNCGNRWEPEELAHGRCCPECNAMIVQGGETHFAEPTEETTAPAPEGQPARVDDDAPAGGAD